MDTIIEKSPSPGSTSEKPLVASAVKEKPPLAGGSPNVRRRKLNRASPVSSRRYSAPPVRRARTFDSTSTTSEVREGIIVIINLTLQHNLASYISLALSPAIPEDVKKA